MQPGGKSGIAAKRSYFAVKLEEGFLGEIFGFRNVADHAKAERVNASLVERIEMGESMVITTLRPGKHFGVGRELLSGGSCVGCRVAKLDRTVLFHSGIGRGSFRRLLLKPGTWHALPLGRIIDSSKNRLMLRQASFLVSIRCSSENLELRQERTR
jgi:hypothetical protein